MAAAHTEETKMRKVIATPIVAGLIGFAALAAPLAAHADTPTTFQVNGGNLTITSPTSSVALTGVTVGTTNPSGQLGTVTVDDERGLLSGGWTATVQSTAFTTGTDPSTVTIAASNVKYTPGSTSGAVGTANYTPGTAAVAIGTPQTAYAADSEVGSAGVSWDPTITVNLPAHGQVAGTYSGTITHSVA
jgi:hypothetical protein